MKWLYLMTAKSTFLVKFCKGPSMHNSLGLTAKRHSLLQFHPCSETKWQPPACWWLLSWNGIDAGWDNGTGKTGFGWLICNSCCWYLKLWSHSVASNLAHLGKAFSAMEALSWITRHGYQRVVLETDDSVTLSVAKAAQSSNMNTGNKALPLSIPNFLSSSMILSHVQLNYANPKLQ